MLTAIKRLLSLPGRRECVEEWWWLKEMRLEVELRKRRKWEWTWTVDEEWWLLLLFELLLPVCLALVWLYYIEAWAAFVGWD